MGPGTDPSPVPPERPVLAPGPHPPAPKPGISKVPAAAPHEAPVPDEASADPRVEDALSRLTELDGMPLAEQVAVFGDIQQRLEGVLADPESRG